MQKKVVSFRSTAIKVFIGVNTCLSEGIDVGVTLVLSVDISVEDTAIDDDVLQELNKNVPRIVRIKNSFFITRSIPPPSGDTNNNENFYNLFFLLVPYILCLIGIMLSTISSTSPSLLSSVN